MVKALVWAERQLSPTGIGGGISSRDATGISMQANSGLKSRCYESFVPNGTGWLAGWKWISKVADRWSG